MDQKRSPRNQLSSTKGQIETKVDAGCSVRDEDERDEEG